MKALKSKVRGVADARETGKELDADKVLRAARMVTGNANSDSDEDYESKAAPEPVSQAKSVTKAKKSKKAGEISGGIEFGEDDLQHFNADKNVLIKERNMQVDEDDQPNVQGDNSVNEEAKLLKSLFVT